ncbi:heme biosynthesis protein HemY [Rhodobacterales bacterium]|nr:heme biosynthesis protein HemY [Rhodobacterales bacterium]
MIRVLLYFVLLFLVAIGFAWLADQPGLITISWNGYDWVQPPVVVVVVAALVIAAIITVFSLIRAIFRSPQIASRFFRRRRKNKGYDSLSQGLIALGTGNAKLARRHGLEADRLLNDEPAAKLLLAQTAQLAGKDDEARERFEAMLEDPQTKALGLHGLFVEAERHKEPVAARHYAEEAAKTAPGLDWAGNAVLGYQAVAHDWDEAIKTLERNYSAKLVDKKTYRRQRAVILTALAQDLESGEPERAYSLAKEAHGLALDLVPAAVLTSRLATRRGDIRKASKVLEATWRLFPHPELAETYAHVRTGDSAVDRLKRVKSLAAQRANTSEGALAIARAALEAREFDEARGQLRKVLQSEPTRQAYVLMAEVEEAEHGDRGRMRDWLGRAVRAPQDKAWVADGIVSAEWLPVSPVTGQLDAFEWAQPGSLAEDEGVVLEDSLFEAGALPVPAVAMTDPDPLKAEEEEHGDDAKTVDLKAADATAKAPPSATSANATSKSEPVTVDVSKKGYEGTTDDVKFSPPLTDLPDKPVTGSGSGAAPATPDPAKPAPTAGSAPAEPAPAAVDVSKAPTPQTEPAASKAPATSQQADAAASDIKPEVKTGPESKTLPENETKPEGKAGPEAQAGPEDKAAAKAKAKGEEPAKASGAGNGAAVRKEASDAKAETQKNDDRNRPIEFPLSRMPDDPGTEDDDDDEQPAKTPRPRFFN